MKVRASIFKAGCGLNWQLKKKEKGKEATYNFHTTRAGTQPRYLTMAIDSKMTAMVNRSSGEQSPHFSREDIDIPTPADNQVLVKISHVAQNPTDGKSKNARYSLLGEVIAQSIVSRSSVNHQS